MNAVNQTLRDLLRGGASPADSGGADDTPAGPAAARIPDGGNAAGQALLQALLDRAQPIYVTDTGGNLVAFSKAFADLSGRLFGAEAARGAGVAAGLMGIIEQLYAERKEIRRSDTLREGDEIRYLISTHYPIHDEGGELIGFGGIYDDVTPLARATQKASEMESWLQDVIRSSSDWVWAADRNFNLTFISPRVSEILEEPSQVVVGRHLFSLGAFDAGDEAAAKTRSDITRRAPFRGRAFLMTGKLGKTHRVLLSGVPVFEDVSGRFIGYRGTGTDVTQRIEAEKRADTAGERLKELVGELRHRNEELAIALEHSKVADKTKMDFLAMMSHELKTPLNSIIGFSDAAMQRIHGPIDAAYSEYFENIHRAGRHLLAIINDLLDTANIERHDLAINIRAERVADLIGEAVSLVGLASVGDSLDLRGLTPETDLVVRADHLRARQILVNLIGNALKFTPDRGKIGIEVTERPEDMVAITVWDTGIGIPEDQQTRVFDKFYQVEQNILSRGTEGTGLGLSISRHLARLMGGDLTLVSLPGQGSRFTLLLPRASHA